MGTPNCWCTGDTTSSGPGTEEEPSDRVWYVPVVQPPRKPVCHSSPSIIGVSAGVSTKETCRPSEVEIASGPTSHVACACQEDRQCASLTNTSWSTATCLKLWLSYDTNVS